MKSARAIIVLSKDIKKGDPIIEASGNRNYVCGLCDYVLLKSVSYEQIRYIVYKCPNCGAFNQIE